MKIYSNHNVSQPLKEAKMLFGRTLQIMRAILQVRFAVSALDSKGLQLSKWREQSMGMANQYFRYEIDWGIWI